MTVEEIKAFCIVNLGLSVAEVDELSPAFLSTLLAEWKKAQQREENRVGRICSVIANVNRDPKKRPQPFTEKDFAAVYYKQQLDPETLNEKILRAFKTLAVANKQKKERK